MQPSDRTARTAGVLYLISIVAGIFAQFFVRMSLIDPTDAAATAALLVSALDRSPVTPAGGGDPGAAESSRTTA